LNQNSYIQMNEPPSIENRYISPVHLPPGHKFRSLGNSPLNNNDLLECNYYKKLPNKKNGKFDQ